MNDRSNGLLFESAIRMVSTTDKSGTQRKTEKKIEKKKNLRKKGTVM